MCAKMTRIQVFVLFFLLTALFFASPKKGLVSKGKRKRPKKSSLGTYVKEIKQNMKQLGADHEKIIGMVLCISLRTITLLVKIRRIKNIWTEKYFLTQFEVFYGEKKVQFEIVRKWKSVWENTFVFLDFCKRLWKWVRLKNLSPFCLNPMRMKFCGW